MFISFISNVCLRKYYSSDYCPGSLYEVYAPDFNIRDFEVKLCVSVFWYYFNLGRTKKFAK